MNQQITTLTQARLMVDTASATLDTVEKYQREIRAALQRGVGTHTFEDVVKGLLSGDMRIHEAGEAFWIAALQTYPAVTIYHVFIAGGKLEDVKAAIPQMQDAAKAAGASKVTMTGRLGWKREFEPLGARSVQITMEIGADG